MAKPYNGFTPYERAKAAEWLKEQIAAGHRTCPEPPCDVCGQQKGFFQLHSEDYSAPYGDHIGQHNLCYPCHMVIHCRHRSREVFEHYRDKVRQGSHLKYPFLSPHWPNFKARILVLHDLLMQDWEPGEPPASTLLDGFHGQQS